MFKIGDIVKNVYAYSCGYGSYGEVVKIRENTIIYVDQFGKQREFNQEKLEIIEKGEIKCYGIVNFCKENYKYL